MNEDKFYSLTTKHVIIYKEKESGEWLAKPRPAAEEFFVNKDHIVTVALNAAFITFKLTGWKLPFELITAYNLDFFRQFNYLPSKEFLELVEEHRKLFEGDASSNLSFADNERFKKWASPDIFNKPFEIIWKARPPITGLPE